MPSLAPYLFTETDVVEDPQEMIHRRQTRNNNASVFLGKDIAVEPSKKPGLDPTGISATSEDS